MKKLRIGICGWGNIATGLYDALQSDLLQQLDDLNISIDCIGARRDNPICDYGDIPVFRDIFDIPDQDVDVVVELIGGVEVARELILKAINNGKPPDRCYDDVPDGASGNRKLDTGCVYCSYKFDCWHDANNGTGLRAFQYATNVKYLTEVNRTPNVPEL